LATIAARLEHQGQRAAGDALAHRGDVVAGQRRGFVLVAHAEAAAEVEVADRDAALGEAVDQRQQAVEGIEERRQAGQLRADVAVHAEHLEVRQAGGACVHRLGVGDGDAELVFLEPGGNVRVGTGVDVGVHPQRDGGAHALFGGDFLQALQLVGGLDVEAVHADFQRAAHVVARFAHAGKDHLAGIAASGEYTLEFAAGHDVEAGAQARQQVEYAQVRVRLDREADQVRNTGQRIGVGAVLRLDMGARVDVGRRAEAFGDGGQRHAFREQRTVAVVEGFHDASSVEAPVPLALGAAAAGGLVEPVPDLLRRDSGLRKARLRSADSAALGLAGHFRGRPAPARQIGSQVPRIRNDLCCWRPFRRPDGTTGLSGRSRRGWR